MEAVVVDSLVAFDFSLLHRSLSHACRIQSHGIALSTPRYALILSILHNKVPQYEWCLCVVDL